jgi:hypothetical protein
MIRGLGNETFSAYSQTLNGQVILIFIFCKFFLKKFIFQIKSFIKWIKGDQFAFSYFGTQELWIFFLKKKKKFFVA